jgi:hypothetical protein
MSPGRRVPFPFMLPPVRSFLAAGAARAAAAHRDDRTSATP